MMRGVQNLKIYIYFHNLSAIMELFAFNLFRVGIQEEEYETKQASV